MEPVKSSVLKEEDDKRDSAAGGPAHATAGPISGEAAVQMQAAGDSDEKGVGVLAIQAEGKGPYPAGTLISFTATKLSKPKDQCTEAELQGINWVVYDDQGAPAGISADVGPGITFRFTKAGTYTVEGYGKSSGANSPDAGIRAKSATAIITIEENRISGVEMAGGGAAMYRYNEPAVFHISTLFPVEQSPLPGGEDLAQTTWQVAKKEGSGIPSLVGGGNTATVTCSGECDYIVIATLNGKTYESGLISAVQNRIVGVSADKETCRPGDEVVVKAVFKLQPALPAEIAQLRWKCVDAQGAEYPSTLLPGLAEQRAIYSAEGRYKVYAYMHSPSEKVVATITVAQPKQAVTDAVNGSPKAGNEAAGVACEGSFYIKKGDKSEVIREINIRLCGFGGNVPTDEFTDQTEKTIRQFQRDYMQVVETGRICASVLRAMDEFSEAYEVSFDDIKCSCGDCTHFGQGLYPEQKGDTKILEMRRKYEYPGIHRSLVWSLRAVMFYTTEKEKDLGYSIRSVSSGYRCHADNKLHSRTSTNHMGKALDLHFNKGDKRTQVVADLEEIRSKIFKKYLGAQVRWGNSNVFSLEPGIATHAGEATAPTWVHYDVRQFELKYLADTYFAQTPQQADGQPILSLVGESNLPACTCAGTPVAATQTKFVLPKAGPRSYTVEDAKEALKAIYDTYGRDIAIIVERMYRDETAHFASKQYINCGTGGMEAHGDPPYYGWDNDFFEQHPDCTPMGLWEAFENKGMSGQGGNQQVTDRKKRFVVMPSIMASMQYKVYYINKYNGNYARWHSTDPATQEHYRKYLEEIKPRFVNEFSKE